MLKKSLCFFNMVLGTPHSQSIQFEYSNQVYMFLKTLLRHFVHLAWASQSETKFYTAFCLSLLSRLLSWSSASAEQSRSIWIFTTYGPATAAEIENKHGGYGSSRLCERAKRAYFCGGNKNGGLGSPRLYKWVPWSGEKTNTDHTFTA